VFFVLATGKISSADRKGTPPGLGPVRLGGGGGGGGPSGVPWENPVNNRSAGGEKRSDPSLKQWPGKEGGGRTRHCH